MLSRIFQDFISAAENSGIPNRKGREYAAKQVACLELANCVWLLLSFSLFPESNPVAPPCTYMTEMNEILQTNLVLARILVIPLLSRRVVSWLSGIAIE